MSISSKLLTLANNTPEVCRKINGQRLWRSGTARVDDVLAVPHSLRLTAAPGTQVTVAGKNLLDCPELDSETDQNRVVFLGELTGDFYFSCGFDYESCKTPSAAQFSFVVDGTTRYMTKGSGQRPGIALSGTLTKITYLNWGYGVGKVRNLQLELGSSGTDYAPWVQTQTAAADAVTDLTAVAPVMTVLAENSAQWSYFPEAAGTAVAQYLAIREKMREVCEQLKEEQK